MPDEPVSKRKSLKNFFAAKDPKEKETTSVEDDNLLKNMLGELDSTAASTSSANGSSIAPKPIKSIRKKATESEIEVKNYMEKLGKKANDVKKKNELNTDVRSSSVCNCMMRLDCSFSYLPLGHSRRSSQRRKKVEGESQQREPQELFKLCYGLRCS